MQRLRSSTFGFVRAALMVALLLSSLASARLQGQMAASAASGVAFAQLCSGERAPGDDGAPAAHAHCVLCNLPVAVAATPPLLATPAAEYVAQRPETPAVFVALAPFIAYQSRGPPLAG